MTPTQEEVIHAASKKERIAQALGKFPETARIILAAALEDSCTLRPGAILHLMKELRIGSLELLMMKLLPLAGAFAQAPISGFRVGAVAQGLGDPGTLYLGANLEFPRHVLSSTIHAEQSAVLNARQHHAKAIQNLAVSAVPCGYCRQFLFELNIAKNLVILFQENKKDKAIHKITMRSLPEIFPLPFGPSDLGKKCGLFDPQDHGLTIGDPPDVLAAAAVSAANRCYAPYTGDYSGVAIESSSGRIYTGSYVENAAFNPAISPLEAALSAANLDRDITAEETFKDIVLVETEPKCVSQLEVTEGLLSKISSAPLRYYRAVPNKGEKNGI